MDASNEISLRWQLPINLDQRCLHDVGAGALHLVVRLNREAVLVAKELAAPTNDGPHRLPRHCAFLTSLMPLAKGGIRTVPQHEQLPRFGLSDEHAEGGEVRLNAPCRRAIERAEIDRLGLLALGFLHVPLPAAKHQRRCAGVDVGSSIERLNHALLPGNGRGHSQFHGRIVGLHQHPAFGRPEGAAKLGVTGHLLKVRR